MTSNAGAIVSNEVRDLSFTEPLSTRLISLALTGYSNSLSGGLGRIISIAKFDNRWNNEAMGNRISDIGRMKSNVDAGNRTNMFSTKKAGKLGTEKNPAIVSVQSKARFEEVSSTFKAHGWNYRMALEPEKPENVSDLNRLLNPLKPMIAEKKVGRNQPCQCGSGKKFKNCCSV
jgi:SWIM/SEC-C metal-binding protein